MYRGKRYKKRKNGKLLLFLVSLIMILTVAVGGSLAYLVTQTENVENSFTVQRVPIEVTNKGTIKNISDEDDPSPDPGTPAYIRAAIVINWADEEGNIYGQAPEVSKDYTLKVLSEEWVFADGYYYYKEPVDAGEETEALVDVKKLNTTPPKGYKLSVEILAQSIQANGPDGKDSAIYHAWGSNAAQIVGEIGVQKPSGIIKNN